MCQTKIITIHNFSVQKLPNGKYLCPSCGTLLGGLDNGQSTFLGSAQVAQKINRVGQY